MITIMVTITMIMGMGIIHTTIITIIIIRTGILQVATPTEEHLRLILLIIPIPIIQETDPEGIIIVAIMCIMEMQALAPTQLSGEIRAEEIQLTETMEIAAIQVIIVIMQQPVLTAVAVHGHRTLIT
jgi:hypothetical protein